MADDKHVYRQDHEKMRSAAQLPITGPAATDTVAASGALELPAGVAAVTRVTEADAIEPIPGEHDHSTEAPTPPGIVGTTGFGTDLPYTSDDVTVDDRTARERAWEGGGRIPGQRSKVKGQR
jgi:hypothetical protein